MKAIKKIKSKITDNNNNIQNKIEYSNKDIFYNYLKTTNHKLDLIRNSIFNLIITNNYVNSIDFEFKNEFDEINKNIASLDNELGKLLKSLNIKFNERKEKS